jgi:hypothetical protein
MSRRGFALFVALPFLGFFAYLIARGVLPDRAQRPIHMENGPIEMGTAILFMLAGVLALSLARQSRLPVLYRSLFLLFSALCAVVALEEISYGQQLFGWNSPQWFQVNNHHQETNLHNLIGNRPSHILKSVGTYGTLIGFVIVPAALMRFKRAYRSGHWTYYLLPRMELMVSTALAYLCSVLWDCPKHILGDFWHQGWNELREFYWAAAAALYVVVMRHRLLLADAVRELVHPSPCGYVPAKEAA